MRTMMVNKTLPVANYRQAIEDALQTHRVVILVGETGSGKTTQIGQYLLNMGETAVITQPRRLPTMSLAARVAEEIGCTLSSTVGYRMSGVKMDSNETDLLFATDGLTLVRELMGQNTFSFLCLDEIHEWGVNIETLLAWARQEMNADATFRLVVMSATLDAEPLAKWFGSDAAIITVPGRNYPVTWRQSNKTTADEAAAFLRAGKDVLVFEPGKAEISRTVARLQGLGLNAVIVPLHADLTKEEQEACLASSDRPKCIVASPLAQTSLTVPGVVVVDSGLERRIEVDTSYGAESFGVESLVLRRAAQDTLRQRAGRSGRTEPGEYVLCSDVPVEERPLYGTPEIQRSLLEGVALRLKLAGLDIEDLEFFHAPNPVAVRQAKSLLRALGAFDSHDRLTKLGRQMALLPVSPRTARMVIEAKKRDVLAEMVACAAIIEQDGVTDRNKRTQWIKLAGGEEDSDVLAHFAVWRAARTLGDAVKKRAQGVHVKAFYDIEKRIELLARAVAVPLPAVKKCSALTPFKREALLRCIAVGMIDQLYKCSAGNLRHLDDVRMLSRDSVIMGQAWVVGRPRNLPGRNGSYKVLTMATKIDPMWLVEAAPQMTERRERLRPFYDPEQDEVVSTTETWLGGQQIDTRVVLDPHHVDAPRLRRNGRNERQWLAWTDKPTIAIPNPANDAEVVANIVIASYGNDIDTGEPLLAYGTVTPKGYGHYTSDPWFRVVWTRDEHEATQYHQGAVRHLEAVRAEAKARAERQQMAAKADQLRQQAEPLLNEVRRLNNLHGYGQELSHELRRRLSIAGYLPASSNVEMTQWITSATQLVADVTTAVKAVEESKAQEAREVQELLVAVKRLRDEANCFACDHDDELSDEHLDAVDLFDVEDNQLPATAEELRLWLKEGKETMRAARAYIDATPAVGVSKEALAALASRFK